MKSYFNLKNYLGSKKLNSWFFNNKLWNKKWITNPNFVLFNFVVVKILLELLRYNYRSLMRVNSKLHYIEKFRSNTNKFKKLTQNSWFAGIRYVKVIKRFPLYYWERYHEIARYFLKRIIQNADLDTKRKVLIPFVIYFEDILYNIYGKGVTIRLWPLKKLLLSSYIIAEQLISLLLWREDVRSPFKMISGSLINGFRLIQIKKAYGNYVKYNNRWPIELINNVSISKTTSLPKGNHNINYLEYYQKKNHKNQYLISYAKPKYNIPNFVLNKMRKLKNLNTEINFLNQINIYKKRDIFTQGEFINNYLSFIREKLDITGMKLRLAGRTDYSKTIQKSMYKHVFYGDWIAPRFSNLKLLKPKTISIPRIRGYLKPHISHWKTTGISSRGAASFSVWISSYMSVDVQELLLHLVGIKELYNEIINKHYKVRNPLLPIKNNNNRLSLKKKKKYL